MTGPETYPIRVTADLGQSLSRWPWVAACAGLMTDKYPPFRLDMGGHEAGTVTHASPA